MPTRATRRSNADVAESVAASRLTVAFDEGGYLILVRDEDGWGFERWQNHLGVRVTAPADAADRRFATPEAAAGFFRQVWRKYLVGGIG